MITKRLYTYRIGYLARLPLRTPYPAQAAAVGAVMRRLPRGSTLLIDNTGIGRAVFDLLVDEGLSPLGVAITAGLNVHSEAARVSVPKLTLISKLIALTQSGFLKVHGDLKEWPVLRRELQNFRPEITPSGRETYNAAQGSHDDLIIATSLCSWWLQGGGMRSWGLYEFYRQEAARAGGDPAPETFCVGVDLGQSIDHTAICVMSKLPLVPDPACDKFFEPGEPEPVDNRLEYRRLADEMAARATPDHPNCRGGETEWVNGPSARPTYAQGSVEWQEQQKGK